MLNKEYFKKNSEKEWRHAAEELLKGRVFRETLFKKSSEGITLKPIYFATDRPDISVSSINSHWLIAQTLFSSANTFNRIARKVLSKGQTALNMNLAPSSLLGIDTDIQMDGALEINDFQLFYDLFDGIQLDKTALFFNAFNTADIFYKWILKLADTKSIDPLLLSVALGADPLSAALIYGGFDNSLENSIEKWAGFLDNSRSDFKPFIITVHADVIHNSGGHCVQQLQYILGSVTTYVNGLLAKGIDAQHALATIRIKVAVGNEHFMEIAKLRAIRLLWENICQAYQVKSVKVPVDVVTSWRFLSATDIYNNMLRATSQAFAAVAGGCDALDVLPFDLAVKKPDEFSLRQARNLHIILAEEAYLNKVQDPAAGAYYLDNLTVELARLSWQKFQDMEKRGGLFNALHSGQWQTEIKTNGLEQEKAFAQGVKKAIGVNCYQPDNEQKPDPVNINHYNQVKLFSEIEPLIIKRLF